MRRDRGVENECKVIYSYAFGFYVKRLYNIQLRSSAFKNVGFFYLGAYIIGC